MTQRKTIAICKEAGLRLERSSIAIAIKHRQAKHKTVSRLQKRLKEVTNDILKIELSNG